MKLKFIIAMLVSVVTLSACGNKAVVSETAQIFGGAARGGVDQQTACTSAGKEGVGCSTYIMGASGQPTMVSTVIKDPLGSRVILAATPGGVNTIGNKILQDDQQEFCQQTGCGGPANVIYNHSEGGLAASASQAIAQQTSETDVSLGGSCDVCGYRRE